MARPDPAPALAAWGLSAPRPLASTVMAELYHVRRRDGTPAVLKCLTPTGQREEARAADALGAWDGDGAVRVFAASPEALLIEACAPEPLARDDEVAVPILAGVVAQLHKAPTPNGQLPALRDRCAALAPHLALPLIAEARRLSDALLADAPPARLLHGDLHHDNVLHSPRGWLAIDPQPVIGDPAYDLANLFSNPLERPEMVLAPGRAPWLAGTLAEALDIDPKRLLAWGFVHACISAAWSLQDGGDPSHRLAVAGSIAPHLADAPL